MKLLQDQAFQKGSCSDELHKVFLHQAVFSAVLSKFIAPNRILILPPTYSYPYHLQGKIPASRRVNALNDLVVAVYEEDHPLDPGTCTDITIREPLRRWLIENAAKG
jgi:hypothetical protein